jgi:aryl-alcohol dehydrogenase-like predicted oxidoreductase
VASVIIGARTLAQLEDNLGAGEIELNTEELAALAQASAPPELYPYRMLREYGARTPNP